jgi:hypothetical protein
MDTDSEIGLLHVARCYSTGSDSTSRSGLDARWSDSEVETPSRPIAIQTSASLQTDLLPLLQTSADRHHWVTMMGDNLL